MGYVLRQVLGVIVEVLAIDLTVLDVVALFFRRHHVLRLVRLKTAVVKIRNGRIVMRRANWLPGDRVVLDGALSSA